MKRSHFDHEVGAYFPSDFHLPDPEPLSLSIARAVWDGVAVVGIGCVLWLVLHVVGAV